MAAEPILKVNTALANNPVAVIGPQYCRPHPVDLAILKKVKILSPGNYVVKDTNGNVLIEVKGILTFFHRKRILLDPAGTPTVTLTSKPPSVHHRWQVFRGESTEAKDLIFSAKTSSVFNLKIKLHVFLANSTTEEVPDFKVKANWFARSCTIFAGDCSTIIAEMKKKSSFLGKDKFMVTLYPNIDYAFIATIVVILNEIHHARFRHLVGKQVAAGGG